MNNKILWLAALGTGSFLVYKAIKGKKNYVPELDSRKKLMVPLAKQAAAQENLLKNIPIQPERKAELNGLGRGMSILPANLVKYL